MRNGRNQARDHEGVRVQGEGHGNTVVTETNAFTDLARTEQAAKPRMQNTRKKGASDTGKTLSSAKPLLSATTRPRRRSARCWDVVRRCHLLMCGGAVVHRVLSKERS